MKYEPEVAEALQQLSSELAKRHPEIGTLLKRIRGGELEEMEALSQFMSLVGKNNLSENIIEIAEDVFGPLVPQKEGSKPPTVYQGSGGLPQLNPLLEAAIVERVQFDGDAPEFRSGPLVPESMPAVPVDTNSRNPVAIGVMLETASKEVKAELDASYETFGADVTHLLEEAQREGKDEATAIAALKGRDLPIPTGVPGYKAGQVPALRSTGIPTGSALAAMPIEEQQQAAWKALSTTQGRRSALRVLEELILTGLRSEGYEIEVRPPGDVIEVTVFARWSVNLSGPNATQSNFSFIDIAAKALLRQLVEQLEQTIVLNPVLEVLPVNTVDIRQVGWQARVVTR